MECIVNITEETRSNNRLRVKIVKDMKPISSDDTLARISSASYA